jgi:hypothetical protein
METLGWIGSKRPRMVSVQAAGCAPIVRAWERGADTAEPGAAPRRTPRAARPVGARGLPDPAARCARAAGRPIAVTDAEMRDAVLDMGRRRGSTRRPRAARPSRPCAGCSMPAGWAAMSRSSSSITGTGLKYRARSPNPLGCSPLTEFPARHVRAGATCATTRPRVGSVGACTGPWDHETWPGWPNSPAICALVGGTVFTGIPALPRAQAVAVKGTGSSRRIRSGIRP